MNGNTSNISIFQITLMALSIVVLSECTKNTTQASKDIIEVAGVVTSEDGFSKLPKLASGVAGVTVTLGEISDNGTIQTVSSKPSVTGADGTFKLHTEGVVHRDLAARNIVIATDGTTTWKAVLSSRLEPGATVYCQPLNTKTTVESNIFLKALEKGYTDLRFSKVASYARKIGRQTTSSQDDAIAQSIYVQSNVENYVANSIEIGITKAKWDSVLDKLDQLQADLEEDLYHQYGAADVNALYADYDKKQKAVEEVEFIVEKIEKKVAISHHGYVNAVHNSALSTDLKFHLIRRSIELQSMFLEDLADSVFTELKAGQSEMNAISEAAANLNTAIANAQTEDDLKASLNSYEAKVSIALQVTLNISAADMDSIKSNIEKFEAELLNTVSNSTSAKVITSAYLNYYKQVGDYLATLSIAKNAPLICLVGAFPKDWTLP
ncbi:MAG TPA: hypothetical protein VJ964_03780 [Balneolaceae bacterium]|nr:hypothetical protein [Balneolaceae bacterium]